MRSSLEAGGRARTLRGAPEGQRHHGSGPAARVHAARPGLPPASKAAGEIIPIAECRRMVLYSSIQAATLALARDLVGKSSRDRSSNSRVEWNDSMTWQLHVR
jgi:hypothetical protein